MMFSLINDKWTTHEVYSLADMTSMTFRAYYGAYNVTVERAGSVIHEQQVYLHKDQTLNLDITL